MQRKAKIADHTENTNQKSNNSRSPLFLIALSLFLIFGFYASVKLGFGIIFLISVSSLLIFLNLGQRDKRTLSAYSVFNKNFEKIPGTFDNYVPGVKLKNEDETRKLPKTDLKDSEAEVIQTYYAKTSRMGNKECFCGSGLKFKKCCSSKNQNKINH